MLDKTNYTAGSSHLVVVAAFLFLAIVWNDAVAAEYLYPITAEKDGIKVSATVRSIDKSYCSYTERWLSGYARYGDRACPSSAIANMQLTYKGNPVPVPAFVYNDLFDIDEIHIQLEQGDGYSVVISNAYSPGDVGYSDDLKYHAFISFAGSVLINRMVNFPKRRPGSGSVTEYIFNSAEEKYIARTPEEQYYEIVTERAGVRVVAVIRKTTTNCANSNIDGCLINHIAKMTVTFHGYNVPVPVSAYSDLALVRYISVMQFTGSKDSRYWVYIRGGDAGLSYRSFLYFNELSILKRSVWSHGVSEETEYVVN